VRDTAVLITDKLSDSNRFNLARWT